MDATPVLRKKMRICAVFHKGENLCFISHLDVLRLMHRALRRAGVLVCYSNGFNPHLLLSFATALPVGYTSDCEWMDLKLQEDTEPNVFLEKLNNSLPQGLKILKAIRVEDNFPSLSSLMRSADYKISINADYNADKLKEKIDAILKGPIMVNKNTKGGIKTVDIRPMIIDIKVSDDSDNANKGIILSAKGVLTASGGLNMELLLKELLGENYSKSVRSSHRAFIEIEGIGV